MDIANGCMCMTLKGKRFATIEEIKEKSKQELLAIPKKRWQVYYEVAIV